MKMRSIKAKKLIVENKSNLKNGAWLTEKKMWPVVTEAKLQNWKKY